MAIFFSILVFFAVVAFCIFCYMLMTRVQTVKEQSQRISQVVNYSGPTGIIQDTRTFSATVKVEEQKQEKSNSGQSEDSGGIRRDSRVSNIPIINQILSSFASDRVDSLKSLLEQTGLKIKTGEFLLLAISLTIVGFVVTTFFFKIPVVGAALGILPFPILQFLRQKRVEAFVTQLPEALDLLQGDLRAGIDIQVGMRHLAEEFTPPLGEEFAKVNVEIGLGLSMSEALNNLVKRVNTMDVQILCTGIIINRELGGNLGILLKSVGETIKERFRLKGMVTALTAQNQATANLLMGMPVGLYFLLSSMSPKTYEEFLSDPMGRSAVIGCLISMGVGYFLIKKLTTLEV